MKCCRELTNLLILCLIATIIGVLSTWYGSDSQRMKHCPMHYLIYCQIYRIQFPIANIVATIQYIGIPILAN